VVNAAGVERFPLFGMSQGCAVSIAYAVRHPKRVSHLVLYGGFALGANKRSPEERERRKALATLMRLEWGADNPAIRQMFATKFMPDAIQLNKAKLLGPDITHVHCDSLKDDEYGMIADTGGTVSVSAESEMHLGCGITPVSRLLAHGIRPSISTDVPSVNSCDVLGALRITLGTHRGEISQQLLDHPNEKTESRLTTRDMLEFATVRGAAAAGLSNKVGRIAPGMQADVVLISYKRVGLFPLHNPTALVVMYATPANVDTVLVAGKVLKRGGKLQGIDYAALMREAEASADYLYSQSKMDPRPASYALQA
jgi:cytosine/adenosine deaminase-related metal-dependent hydrolase